MCVGFSLLVSETGPEVAKTSPPYDTFWRNAIGPFILQDLTQLFVRSSTKIQEVGLQTRKARVTSGLYTAPAFDIILEAPRLIVSYLTLLFVGGAAASEELSRTADKDDDGKE